MAIAQARDLLRWRSPLRTELWAAGLAAGLEQGGAAEFVRELIATDTAEARLTLAALLGVDGAPLARYGSGGRPGEDAGRKAGDGRPEDGGHFGDAGLDDAGLDDAAEPSAAKAGAPRASAAGGGPTVKAGGPDEGAAGGDTAVDAGGLDEDAAGGGFTVEAGALAGGGGVGAEAGEVPAAAGRVGTAADVVAWIEAGRAAVRASPEWVARMGRVTCEGARYGKADRYGLQTLAALRFGYPNGKEPHVLVVGIDQVNGGLAVDALVDEPRFLDDLRLEPAEPGVVAGRMLDAFELTERVMGAMVADTFPSVRPFALGRALAVPHAVRSAPDGTVSSFRELPDLPGAAEAFEKLVEFVGDRPLWWSPARVSQFLTAWLPREAILSEEAVAAMPEVVRAWSRFNGGHREVLERVDADAPSLAALMADESLAGLGKRIALNRLRAEDHRR